MQENSFRLVIAQLNPVVGDVDGNCELIIETIREAVSDHGAQCVVFPELVLTGYPPEDLLLREDFIDQCEAALARIAAASTASMAIVGAPQRTGEGLYNAAYVFGDGRELAVARKQCLPNYSVFDEERYFVAGNEPCIVQLLPGFRAGLTICEDIWCEGPARQAASAGADLIININASPFHIGKHEQRIETLRQRISETNLPIIYANLVGGQDELVFDGLSLAMDRSGEVSATAPAFLDGLLPLEIASDGEGFRMQGDKIAPPGPDQTLYEALVCGVRDYIAKNGFQGALLGVSGGIDSALTLAIAADALGNDRVTAVMMPSQYTADMSREDAEAEAKALGVEFLMIPIQAVYDAFLDLLSPVFQDVSSDVTEENIQARVRGLILMALSNKKGAMVLATGNKSEMAVGYATLYGDMAGGFSPLKDVYKTLVYRLARYRNSVSPVIPERVLERAPTAELAPDQFDQDTLPPYGMLDEILQLYIERDRSPGDIIEQGFDRDVVTDVVRRVDCNEYKRRQASPGIKVTERAFGKDRRFPIARHH